MSFLSRRRFLRISAAGSLVGLVGCKSEGLSLFGYQLGNDALYDKSIDSVFVRVIYNRTLQTGPYREMEVSLTQEIVRQIGAVTPYHVVSDPNTADTELIGSIVGISKNSLNTTQQNTVREGEVVITLDLVWRDLRTGKILSAPRKRRNPNQAPPAPVPGVNDPFPVPFDADVTQAPEKSVTPRPEPVRLVATGRYLMELGETNATAEQRAEIKMAKQIVSMMEKRW